SALHFSSLDAYHTHPDLHSFPTRRSSDLHTGYEWATTARSLTGVGWRVTRVARHSTLVTPYADKKGRCECKRAGLRVRAADYGRSEEHTSELQSLTNLVCRLLLEKKKKHR